MSRRRDGGLMMREGCWNEKKNHETPPVDSAADGGAGPFTKLFYFPELTSVSNTLAKHSKPTVLAVPHVLYSSCNSTNR